MNIRAKGLFKVIFYMPNIMTAATIAALALSMIISGGFIHQIAVHLGVVESAADPITGLLFTRGMIAFVNFWLWFGNTMIVLIASMMSINQGIFEAARIDGANKIQIFFRITLPSIKPVFIFTLIQSLVGGLQMFDVPNLLMSDVTATLNTTGTNMIMVRIQELAFPVGGGSPNMGLAAAMSVILFLITMICSVTVFATMRNRSDRLEAKLRRIHLKDERIRRRQIQQGGDV
jgi:multiple sugar transport system permease protein